MADRYKKARPLDGRSSYRKLKEENTLLWKVAEAAKQYKREMENPVPDLAYRITLRGFLFKALEALPKRSSEG